nr:MAG TPA: DNA-directed RNA polymerase subunit beta' [Caudoviricetes sp.]
MEYRLGLLNDDAVLSLSNGEVKNFGKYLDRFIVKKAEINGLFCQRIFGPIVDYTCECGITKKVSNGEICSVRQVPYISSYERNNRFGHIELNTVILPPLAIEVVANMWGLSKTKFKEFIVDNKGYIGFVENNEGRFYTDDSKRYKLEYSLDKGENFVDNLYEMLLESEKLGINPYVSMMENPNQSAQIYFSKGFDIFSMLLSKFPVSPAGMRDRKKVGEELVYHEDNLIYHRIIREALRINSFRNEIEDKKELRELIAQETKIIQKLINGFILTGYRSNTKKLIDPKIDNLNTKEGLLRSEALGKRIDFSGRSVITSGPFLPIDTVGVPILMLIELFTPDLIRELTKKFIAENKIGKIKALRKAKSLIKEKTNPILYDLVEYISKDYMVMMNRAPSLHRFSVLSFRIKPVSDKCLFLPPVACKPFAGDFDGDQLSCYIIHSKVAKKEQRELISYTYNLMSSEDKDKPNVGMSHEMIVGSFLLTKAYEDWKAWEIKRPIKYYDNSKDIEKDYSLGFVKREDKVVLIDKDQNKRYTICVGAGIIHSKTGIIVDYLLGKGGISKFISTIGNKYDEQPEIAVDLLSKAQTLFFETATKYGLSIAYHDCKKSEEFTQILEKARYEAENTPLSELSDIEKQGEKVPLRAVIWDKAFNTCVDKWFKETPQDNALQIMGKAGARVTDVQVKAMILGKGLQSTMDNKLDPNAIYKGLSEGLDPISYMKTCGPARRGFASNMAVVPSSGYGTRQFVTACRDLSITTNDCGNVEKGIVLPKEKALYHYDLNNTLITEDNLHNYNDYIEVRSPLTCKHTNGLCKKCCGVNLKNGKDWDLNFGIGTVAAQTIMSILTQMSLSYKHSAGSVSLATFGARADNLLADFFKYLGARSTQLVPLSMSLIEDTILDLEGENYEEKASNFVLRCDEILKSLKMPSIWYEILGRGLSNIVFKGKRAIGYRHKGYPCNNPEFVTMFKANTSSPSWLKGASFGYTKDVIKQAIAQNLGTCGLITEKIIEGKNIIDG